ncbi:hypothetical protein COO91_06582 [Nostoc flagelliforme CCNUN1]|uniref:Uncharacterized protein n=1 Tax=Nostoc flagelliforme CCNUN1 TaxID=2038116 RepID=A0A2K8T0M9_9NOSO|nr:hypothetical protein COO91_06582 [Nostoc flagelliforme CCNUN1]
MEHLKKLTDFRFGDWEWGIGHSSLPAPPTPYLFLGRG